MSAEKCWCCGEYGLVGGTVKDDKGVLYHLCPDCLQRAFEEVEEGRAYSAAKKVKEYFEKQDMEGGR